MNGNNSPIVNFGDSQLNNNDDMKLAKPQSTSDVQGLEQNAFPNKSADPGQKHLYKKAGLDSQKTKKQREELGVELRKEKIRQQLFERRNITNEDFLEMDIDSIPIVWDTPYDCEKAIPPVPFNTPVTPVFNDSQKFSQFAYVNAMNSSCSSSLSHDIDLDDQQLMSNLYEAAAKLENEEKRKQTLEKQDLKRIVTRDHSLDELLKEMPESKQNTIPESYSYTQSLSLNKKDVARRLKVAPKNRPSNKYNDLSLDEVEKLTSVRRQAMEYKGAMSIAEKETVRREKINDSISILRKIIPTVTDSTENTEVFEIAARYVAFLRQKTEGKHDRGYLYEHLEL